MELPDVTVAQHFDIDADALADKCCESNYWCSCHEFYEQVKDRKISTLTEKQVNWLLRISDALDE